MLIISSPSGGKEENGVISKVRLNFQNFVTNIETNRGLNTSVSDEWVHSTLCNTDHHLQVLVIPQKLCREPQNTTCGKTHLLGSASDRVPASSHEH